MEFSKIKVKGGTDGGILIPGDLWFWFFHYFGIAFLFPGTVEQIILDTVCLDKQDHHGCQEQENSAIADNGNSTPSKMIGRRQSFFFSIGGIV